MSYFLSLILILAVVACSGFASLTASAVLLPQAGASPANPFITYADILPGQPKSAVAGRGFLCSSNNRNYYGTEGDEVCVLDIEGEFAQIQLKLSQGVVASIHFIAANDMILVGDLMMWLRDTTVVDQCAVSGFSWHEQPRLIWTTASDLSPFSPLWKVTVTRTC